MNSVPSSSQPLIAQDFVLPADSVEALFSGPDAVGHSIQRAVSPFDLRISPIAGGICLTGDEVIVSLAVEMMSQISQAIDAGQAVTEPMVNQLAAATVQSALKHGLAFRLNGIRSPIRPKSLSQFAFMNAMLRSNQSLIFGIGPTGTGKTHLAIAAGLSMVADRQFKSLVVTRPRSRLEGEDMASALRTGTDYDEALTPIEDALRDLIGRDDTRHQIEHGLLVITPLSQMRGRSFNDSFILIDEAQNMGKRTMRMALTRLGQNSRMVVTGDPAQIALAGNEPSGLPHILKQLAGTDIALVHRFNNNQIIRNDTVAKIEAIYSREDDPAVRAAA